ncbi:LysM peptidoglycan-binding domain-containing protein [Arenicella xantha]|uniref:LysM repeat protein n=1 Tax=Arenicella xantha TaxID=644221 RepID=A0A395JMH3_9GAMM|nr:LysM peptidoglycan-binding domain-containing protein [Arenicella xantha]RBP50804.1 LysM repeat protein [Arenicella xantha]
MRVVQVVQRVRCAKPVAPSPSAIITLAAATLLVLFGVSAARASTPLLTPVGVYELQCDETFSCPTSLMPRVAFWVEVFSRWDTGTAVFHDKDNPHRVYSTVKREEGCRRSRKGDSIYRERSRLKRDLENLASKLSKDQTLSDSEQFLHSLFVGESVSEVRAAAGRIRCQSGNKDRMREALTQYVRYQPTILEALKGQNLTPELQYLPFVESAFNPEALSHVGAAGLWQIMPSTGRTLGLTVDAKVDQRYDPTAATFAAALCFRNSVDNLSETAFENGHSVVAKDLNPFVITSYNYGVRGMQRAIKQVGLDYERLLVEYKSPSFQTAVKNFYASFLAARHVAKNSEKFFGVIQAPDSDQDLASSTVELTRATSVKRVAQQLNVDAATLKKLNPALKRVIWEHKALIPKGYPLRLPNTNANWTASIDKMNALPRETERPGFVWHRVRSGQTACGIAEQYRASCRKLVQLNRLNKMGTIYVGDRIKVPTATGGISVAKSSRSPAVETSSTMASSASASSDAKVQSYRVKRGDTSCAIAERFGMRCAEFLAVNGLTTRSVIKVGQQVRVSSANSWHTVLRGQTPCGIADIYGVRCSALLDANRLQRSSIIQVGQRLRVPSKGY